MPRRLYISPGPITDEQLFSRKNLPLIKREEQEEMEFLLAELNITAKDIKERINRYYRGENRSNG